MILAYFQSSRGLDVASKSPVLCSVSGKFQYEKASSVLRVTRQRIREAQVTFKIVVHTL